MNNELSVFANAMLTWLIPIVVSLCLGYATKVLVPSVTNYYKTHTSERQQNIIAHIMHEVFRAAEESRLAAKLRGGAFDTLMWATLEAQTRLNQAGIDWIDASTIVAMFRAEIQRQSTFPALAGTGEGGEAKSLSPKDELERHWA